MKNTMYKIFSATLVAFVALGCTNNFKYKDVAVYPVSSLGFPADDSFVTLEAGTDKVLEFSWAPGAAEDGNPVQYELLFSATPGGEPVSVMDAGMTNLVVLTHKDLNKMMGTAGVESGATGTVYWTVRASRGPRSATFDSPHKLDLRRMLGFDEIPPRLFLTGAASETGDALADAREFRLTSAAGEEGEFEIYTEIGDGTFNMVSTLGDDRRTFGIVNGLLEETTEGASVASGIYRINVDFTVKGISLTQILEVNYDYPQNRSYNTQMEYIGGGVWQLLGFELQLDRPTWGTRGFEERYRFEVVTSQQNEVWGPSNEGLDGAPSSLDFKTDYFALVPRPRTDDWNPKWKWHTSAIPDLDEAGGSDTNPWRVVNIKLDMSGETARYFHNYEILP